MNLDKGALLDQIKQSVNEACQERADLISFNANGTFTARRNYYMRSDGESPILFALGVRDAVNPVVRKFGMRSEIVNYADEYPTSCTLVAIFRFEEARA